MSNLIIRDQHTEAELAAGEPLRELAPPRYADNPTVVIDGETFTYDPLGVAGPQLLNHDFGHLRQAESDANWPGGKAAIAERESDEALVALSKIDGDSIRDIREYIAAQPDAPPTLVAREQLAVEKRKKVRRREPR